ncbi:MAG: secondary thiamine-phosphate synthase enzyme YjbQ [Candidatus Krumholzibacteriota bacterium]|nr:secondary thiamine-phosphate synthase enzyme YjbQ [Candidatus Krumholzibacteriota bacterium]
MVVYNDEYKFSTEGDGTIIDLSDRISATVLESEIRDGHAAVFVPGSTAAVTTIEYEPGLLSDLPDFFEKIIPSNVKYMHDETWGDGNGFSHLRAALVGPSVTIPVSDGKLLTGTW